MSAGIHSTSAAEIAFPALEAHPGASVVALASFVSQGQSVSAIQFDMEYDDSVLQMNVTVAEAIRSSGKHLYVTDLAPNRKRVLVAGLNQNVIPDGALLRIFLNVKPEAPVARYSVQVLQAQASNPAGAMAQLSATPFTVTVQAGQGSALLENGVLNAASLVAGPIVPGELITLIGSSIGPDTPVHTDGLREETLLGGTRVLFDGVAGRLLYAAPGQINVVTPDSVATVERVLLQTESEGRARSSIVVPVAVVNPGLFTDSGTGTGQGAVRNQDASMNGAPNPALRGSMVTIFATGTGVTDAATQRPLLPFHVWIGGDEAEVIDAATYGAVTQIICRVPERILPGLSVPVVLEMATRSSQPGVTIAVY